MSSDHYAARAAEDFSKARSREIFTRILSVLRNETDNNGIGFDCSDGRRCRGQD